MPVQQHDPAPAISGLCLSAVTGLFVLCAGVADCAPMAPDARAIASRVASQRLAFVPNAGQWDAAIAFRAQSFAGGIVVTHTGDIVYQLPGPAAADGAARGAGWNLVERFDSERRVTPRGTERHAAKVSYLVGDAAQHRSPLDTFGRLALGEVFPGVSVELRATGDNVEKLFTVAPGGDPAAIRMMVEGAQQLAIDADGALVATTGLGEVRYTPPVAFQTLAGDRRDVPVRYALTDPQSMRYGFAVGDYDPSQPLVIDPLLRSTFVGGNGEDRWGTKCLLVHPVTADIYVCGGVDSNPAPGVGGGAQPNKNAGRDVYIARLDPTLATLIQATYLGGSLTDQANVLALHPNSGEILVAGQTASVDFPGRLAGAQTTLGGVTDGFVSRLSADLTTLHASTFHGGTLSENAFAVAVIPTTGEVCIGGQTQSTDLPVTAGAVQPASAGSFDGYVACFSDSLATRTSSTYFGATGVEAVYAMAFHPGLQRLVVAGDSNIGTLPGTAGNAQTALGGTRDGFVSTLDLTLGTADTTYAGGTLLDSAFAVAVDPATGDILVAGETAGTVPGLDGAQTVAAGGTDGFVMRFTASLATRLHATLIGGALDESVADMTVDPLSGDIIIAGSTLSSSLPGTAGAIQATHANPGGGDTFVARFSSDLGTLRRTTFFGGAGDETEGNVAVALNPYSGEIIVAGDTSSATLPGTSGAFQVANAALRDFFVARLSSDLAAADRLPNLFSFPTRTGVIPGSLQATDPIQVAGFGGGTVVSTSGAPGSALCANSGGDCSNCDTSGAWVTSFVPGGTGSTYCFRHLAADAIDAVAETVVSFGAYSTIFRTITAGPSGPGCRLDIDGNGTVDALTDGLMLLRAMFGLTGTAVTSGAIGPGATRGNWALIGSYLNGNCGTSFN